MKAQMNNELIIFMVIIIKGNFQNIEIHLTAAARGRGGDV